MTASLVHDPSGRLQCPVVEVDTDSLDFSKLLVGEICTSSLLVSSHFAVFRTQIS